MKVLKKVMLVIVLLSLSMSLPIVNAAYDWTGAKDDLITSANADNSSAATEVQEMTVAIVDITRTIAMGIAIIMIIAVAMKYMMAAPGDRAEIKKHAVVYVVGAIVLFASSAILTIIAKFGETI